MNAFRTAALWLLALATPLSACAWDVPSGPYGLDKTHGYITFTYSHLGFSNPHVGFNSFEVELNADSENIESSTVTVVIDAASIESRVEKLDEHFNGEDFFDTAKFPTITFSSTEVRATDEENVFEIDGELSIKDITKPVTLYTTINKAAKHPFFEVPAIGITAITEVSRSEWGLSTAVPFVSDAVSIFIDVELLMQDD